MDVSLPASDLLNISPLIAENKLIPRRFLHDRLGVALGYGDFLLALDELHSGVLPRRYISQRTAGGRVPFKGHPAGG
jgi:hypothetical protein